MVDMTHASPLVCAPVNDGYGSLMHSDDPIPARRADDEQACRFARQFGEALRAGDAKLAEAIQESRDGTVTFVDQCVWLARVLHSRDFPIERLTANLLIASDLTRNHGELGPLAQSTGDVLAAGADAVNRLDSADFAEPHQASSDSALGSSRRDV